jgi:hypothetical protein
MTWHATGMLRTSARRPGGGVGDTEGEEEEEDQEEERRREGDEEERYVYRILIILVVANVLFSSPRAAPTTMWEMAAPRGYTLISNQCFCL